MAHATLTVWFNHLSGQGLPLDISSAADWTLSSLLVLTYICLPLTMGEKIYPGWLLGAQRGLCHVCDNHCLPRLCLSRFFPYLSMNTSSMRSLILVDSPSRVVGRTHQNHVIQNWEENGNQELFVSLGVTGWAPVHALQAALLWQSISPVQPSTVVITSDKSQEKEFFTMLSKDAEEMNTEEQMSSSSCSETSITFGMTNNSSKKLWGVSVVSISATTSKSLCSQVNSGCEQWKWSWHCCCLTRGSSWQ